MCPGTWAARKIQSTHLHINLHVFCMPFVSSHRPWPSSACWFSMILGGSQPPSAQAPCYAPSTWASKEMPREYDSLCAGIFPSPDPGQGVPYAFSRFLTRSPSCSAPRGASPSPSSPFSPRA